MNSDPRDQASHPPRNSMRRRATTVVTAHAGATMRMRHRWRTSSTRNSCAEGSLARLMPMRSGERQMRDSHEEMPITAALVPWLKYEPVVSTVVPCAVALSWEPSLVRTMATAADCGRSGFRRRHSVHTQRCCSDGSTWILLPVALGESQTWSRDVPRAGIAGLTLNRIAWP